jgi:hypothetical protein
MDSTCGAAGQSPSGGNVVIFKEILLLALGKWLALAVPLVEAQAAATLL